MEGESEEEASSSDESVQAPNTLYGMLFYMVFTQAVLTRSDLASGPSGPSSDGDGEDIQSSSVPPTGVKSTDATFDGTWFH